MQENQSRFRSWWTQLARYEADATPWWRDRAMVFLAVAALYLPFLGSFGLWDPWETHYGEVGRQILERNDWISIWWGSHWQDAGGSQEGAYFFSKPILLKWMMAMGMTVFGFSELGIRIGTTLVAMLGVLLAYSFGASVYNRRTGLVIAGVLATSPFWYFLGRQAQTDMPYVGTMTVGMMFFMMGMFGKDRDKPADKFTYILTFAWMAIVCVPQISLIVMGLSRWRGSTNAVMQVLTTPPQLGAGITGGLLAVGLILLLASLRAAYQGREALQKKLAYGSLAAVWIPLVVLLGAVLAVSSNHVRDLNGWFSHSLVQASIYSTLLGFAIYQTCTRPIVERRRIYLLNFYIFIGLASLAKGLLGFMLPGAIIFFYLVLTREWRLLSRMELLRGIPVFIAVTFPWYAAMLIRHGNGFWNRFFVHDHFKRLAAGVHQIDTGSFEHFMKWLGYGLFPWTAFVPAALVRLVSTPALEKEDESRANLMLFLWVMIAFTLFTLSSTKFHHYIFPVVPALAILCAVGLARCLDDEALPNPWPLFVLAIPIMLVLSWDLVMEPQSLKNLFTYKYDRDWHNALWDKEFRITISLLTLPAVLGALALLVKNRRAKVVGLIAIILASAGLAVFSLNVYMPRISSIWSQKGLWDYYYEVCTRTDGPPGTHKFKRICEEPIVAFKLNWRGETFYSQNEVIPIRDDDDFTHFLSQIEDREFFGIMEYARYRGEFQRKLPQSLKGKACIAWDGNQKFVLAKVPCAPDDPLRKPEVNNSRKR